MNTQPAAPKTTYTSPKANSFSDKILRLELLATKLASRLDSMPYIQPLYTELTQLITDMKGHEFDSKGVKANFSQAIVDGKAMMKKGDGLRSRLASALAFEHGPTSVLLTEFGLRPRSTGGGRKKGSPPPTPDPNPNPTPQPEVQAATPAVVPAK